MNANDDRTGADASELIHEDFSVYVAPAHSSPAAGDDELIARLEPAWWLSAWLALVVFLFAGFVYDRSQGYTDAARGARHFRGLDWLPMDTARLLWPAVFIVGAVILVLPLVAASSYYAELYGDRLVVRRGKVENAVPLDHISQVRPLTDDRTDAVDPSWLDVIDVFARGARSLKRGVGQDFVVITTFETTFFLPPFPGAEEFATKLDQQWAKRTSSKRSEAKFSSENVDPE